MRRQSTDIPISRLQLLSLKQIALRLDEGTLRTTTGNLMEIREWYSPLEDRLNYHINKYNHSFTTLLLILIIQIMISLPKQHKLQDLGTAKSIQVSLLTLIFILKAQAKELHLLIFSKRVQHSLKNSTFAGSIQQLLLTFFKN